MSLTMKSMSGRVDSLALIGGFIMLVDTAWGGIAALGLDLSRMNELVLAFSFVLGFPIYLLDLWINKRIAVSMLGLFLFRWIATCFGGPTPVLCSPWRVTSCLSWRLFSFSCPNYGGKGNLGKLHIRSEIRPCC